jgi:hypothetical protein
MYSRDLCSGESLENDYRAQSNIVSIVRTASTVLDKHLGLLGVANREECGAYSMTVSSYTPIMM